MHFHPLTVQAHASTPLGAVRLTATPKGLSGLWFAQGERHIPAPFLDGPNAWPQDNAHPVLQAAVAQLQEYFGAGRTVFDLPLDLSAGTPFQQSVWLALQGIAHGQTTSYGALSTHLGRPTAVRAVAGAIGRNPISVIVPCHRVLGRNGHLTGYAAGLERKAWLLQSEGVPFLGPVRQCQAG